METRNRVGIGLSYRPAQATLAGGIDSLVSIPGLLKSLKIPPLPLVADELDIFIRGDINERNS